MSFLLAPVLLLAVLPSFADTSAATERVSAQPALELTVITGVIDWGTSESVSPSSPTECPSTHPVKGNIGSERIYHRPGDAFYDRTQPEECFTTSSSAKDAGYRASSR